MRPCRPRSRQGATPQAQLGALAQAYLTFALSNPQLWAALFDHKMPPGRDIPDWHLAEHAVLIAHIAAPLARLQPKLDPDALAMRARTLFSAVHGIVKISLEQRFIGTPAADLSRELAAFVGFVTDGMGGQR